MAEYKRIQTIQDLINVLSDGEEHDFILKEDGSQTGTTRMWLDEDKDGETVFVVSPGEMIEWECDQAEIEHQIISTLSDQKQLFAVVTPDEE